MSTKSWDVIVIGGGVVGLCAALAMQQRHRSVALLDSGTLAVDPTLVSPRVYAINHASYHRLTELGVWSHLDPQRVSPYQYMHIWDAASNATIDFDSRLIAHDRLGSIIDEANLRQALLGRLQHHHTSLNPDCQVTAVNQRPDSIEVMDNHQRCWSAKLLIIADGANSPTRQLLKVPATTWPYHQNALVATVRTELAHQKTASQVFLRDGVLAFLPLMDERACSIVWSAAPKRINTLQSLPDEAFNQQLTTAFNQRLGSVTLAGLRHQFPLHMRHTKQYAGSRWLLMGDAAHTIHPLAGLGLNIGLADLSTWLAIFDQAPAMSPTQKGLRSYQRQRQQAVWQVIALMEGLKTLFLNPLTPIAALRGLGLALCNQSTILKRLIIEHAAGAGYTQVLSKCAAFERD